MDTVCHELDTSHVDDLRVNVGSSAGYTMLRQQRVTARKGDLPCRLTEEIWSGAKHC
jgi:hypothetical protein